jgi:phage-related protein
MTTSSLEDISRSEAPKTRPISWIKSALRDFEAFPVGARTARFTALTLAADGGKADIAKPLKGLGSGVFEIALPFRGDAFRVVYAVQIAEVIWILHAFQKKSVHGARTPKPDIDLIRERLKRVKEICR